MKTNEAPKKIYLEKIYPDNGVLPNGLNYNQSPDDIEYTRTDAFIEKACEWIDEMIWDYLELKHPNADTYFGVDMERFKEDFKKAMNL